MELSFTTFILEIINFLVLVWILKRLFFTPVKRVLEERKAAVFKTLKNAQDMKTQADQLRTQYEGRLQKWEDEKEKAQEALEKSLTEERARRLKEIEISLTSEREKMRALEDKKSAEQKERMEREAMKQSLEFTSRLLENLASPELESKIIKIALDDLSRLGTDTSGSPRPDAVCAIRTAFALSDDQKNTIRNTLKSKWGDGVPIQFLTDVALLAGIEVVVGSTVIRANLRDELAYFSEAKKL